MLWRAIPLVLAALVACLSATASSAGSPATRRPVVLVPIGDVPATTVQQAAAVLRTELALRVRVLPKIVVPPSVRDAKRNQVVANRLLNLIQHAVPASNDGRSAVIGLTKEDMYPLNTGWRWAFAYHGSTVGVVSLARMDETTFGLDPNPGLLARRTHKYILRSGLMLALDQPETSDPRSLLYDSIVSTADLDFMEPTYPPPPVTTAQRQWLRTTEVGCHAAGQTWTTVLTALNTATAGQVPGLLTRWADTDATLASRISPATVGAPTSRARVLVTDLRQRAAYLRGLKTAPLPLSNPQLKHLASLTATIRSAMYEIGSKTCASETTVVE
jgi:predicted Zn-dependent protease